MTQDQGTILNKPMDYLKEKGMPDLAQKLGTIQDARGMATFYQELCDLRAENAFGTEFSDHQESHRGLFNVLWGLQRPMSYGAESKDDVRGPFFGFSVFVTPTIEEMAEKFYTMTEKGSKFDPQIYQPEKLLEREGSEQIRGSWADITDEVRDNGDFSHIVREFMDLVRSYIKPGSGIYEPKVLTDPTDFSRQIGFAEEALESASDETPGVEELRALVSQFRRTNLYGSFSFRDLY
ncbi:MAG: hypothetical protein IH934_00405 [Nanoarchaeota archaeon]|nr:hypothetical protein [Nanoarchaeota archaeon]